jgi:hypothetical protein
MSRYRIALALIVVAGSCFASPKKLDKFLPPVESHGAKISGYGCDRQHVADGASAKDTSYWILILWAQYGDQHKRYWQKSYDSFQIPVKYSMNSSGESAGSGGAIGAYGTKSYDFTSMDKACADWGVLMQTTLKIAPDGSPKTP